MNKKFNIRLSGMILRFVLTLMLVFVCLFSLRAQTDTSNFRQNIVVPDTLYTQDPTLPQECDSLRYFKKPFLSVSTNVLFDLAITPNFELEFPIGKSWSIYGEYTFPWWITKANDRAWQILKLDLGVRYWFRGKRARYPLDILRGHFLGLDLSAGYYDIEPHHKGWQGEFQLAALEYGYAWKLGDAWRLDAFIDLGWMGTHYRYYKATEDDQHLLYQHSAKLNWFGPTKLGVSIKYIIGRKPKHQREVKK